MTETPKDIPNTPEAQRPIPLALLLDVDGVITNPVEKKVTETVLFSSIETQLKAGNVVTLNTERSNEWMIEQVIQPLSLRVLDKSILKNFFAVGEKGLTWVSFGADGKLKQGVFDRDGKPIEGFDLNVFLDTATVEHFKTLGTEAKKLIDSKYSHSTFFDSSKKAMVSTEMHDGYDQLKYAGEQQQFTNELRDIVERLGLEGKFKIDPTTIATDIQIREAGKRLGAKRILDRLKMLGISPQHFITAGDSSSDLEMADELSAQNKSVEFFYVNPKKPLSVEKPYKITTSEAEFGNGTIEVFQKLSAA